jgi:hypothetical protein
MTDNDFVIMPAEKAIELASAQQVRITEARRQGWERLIAQRRGERARNRLWMPWLKPLTSEAIRRAAEKEYPNPGTEYGFEWNRCGAVILLAQAHLKGSVTLSANTVFAITCKIT